METTVFNPTSINKKHSADFKTQYAEMSEHEKKVFRNRKRGFRIANNARVNKGLYTTVCEYIQHNDLTAYEMEYFTRLRRSLQTCCQHSLFRQYENGNALEYIASQTCKHKMCKVCNTEREKAIRKKYLSYFRKNQLVDKKTGEVSKTEDFDFMHLTLTVPHSENGFRGQKWYATELMSMFNAMRKTSFWNYFVWGGEFGVEVTKKQSGLHIHIHALLIVHRETQNRNRLHREILLKWNELTASETAQRKEFSEDEKIAIKKGNKTLSDTDINSLDASGATLVGLESLYVLKDKKIGRSDKWDADKSKWKHYINATDENEFMSGILECLKYHFEPIAFDKENGVYQFELLREILPNIYKKPLYRKFGNLHGVQELNINENSDTVQDAKEAIEQIGDIPTHPETGEEDNGFNYVVVSARNVFYDIHNKYKPSIPSRARRLDLTDSDYTIMTAIIEMTKKRKQRYLDDAKIYQ